MTNAKLTVAFAGVVTEQLDCLAVNTGGAAPAGGAKPKPVFNISASAEVAAPLLVLSKQSVVFSYMHAVGQQPSVMTQQLDAR